MEDFEQLDYYELLNVTTGASPEEIKRAYRQQIAHYHPDRYTNHPPAEQAYASQRSQRINEAYRVLSDFRQRQLYDRSQAIRSTRHANTNWNTEREPVRPATSSAATPNRDRQAELYEQAQAYLKAGRYAKAAATLRQLQQINPFYRDSAMLLAQAEAASQGDTPPPLTQSPAAQSAQTSRTRRFLLFGGIGAAVFLTGTIAALLLFRPSPATIASNPDNPSPTAAQTALRTVEPTRRATRVAQTSLAVAATTRPPRPTRIPASPTRPPRPTRIPASPTREPSATSLPSATPLPSPTPLPSSTPTPPPVDLAPGPATDSGTLLLAYDFSNPDGWAQVEGFGWRVGSDGAVYRIIAQPGSGNIWSYRTAFIGVLTDFQVGVDMQVTGGTGGLVVHFVDRTNYLALLLEPQQGSYRIEQYVNGFPVILAAGDSSAIDQDAGATNRLTTRMQGGNVELLINGESTALVRTDLFQTQLYGLVAIPSDTTVEAVFDSLEIRALE